MKDAYIYFFFTQNIRVKINIQNFDSEEESLSNNIAIIKATINSVHLCTAHQLIKPYYDENSVVGYKDLYFII